MRRLQRFARPALGNGLIVLAVLAATAASAVFAFTSVTVVRERPGLVVDRATGAGPSRTFETTHRIVDDPSPFVVVFVVAPALIAAVPLLARRRALRVAACAVSATLLLGWVFLLAFGGGELYLPAVLLVATAGALFATQHDDNVENREVAVSAP